MAPRPVVFLSDFGPGPYVGLCHARLHAAAPEARIIDLDHGIDPQDVRAGAVTLARALPHLPDRSVVLAVVDPGVGGERRGVAVETVAGHDLVGPDNGLLWPAVERAGGAAGAVDLASSRLRREQVSPTFHGRDVFAPVAAHLAAGGTIEAAGSPVDPESLARLQLPTAGVGPGVISAHVLTCDRFGNLALAAGPEDAERAGIREGDAVEARCHSRSLLITRRTTFAEADEGGGVLYVDSAGSLAIAVRDASAARALGVGPDSPVELHRRPGHR